MVTPALHDNNSQLAQRVHLLEEVLLYTDDYLHLMDLEGRLLYTNPAGARLVGMVPEQMVGKFWREIGYPPHIDRRIETELERVARTRQPVSGEISFETDEERSRTFEYTLSPLDADSKEVEAVVVISRDITARVQAREEQARSLALVHAALESAVEGTIITDRDGGIVLYNQRFQDIWNLPNEWYYTSPKERFGPLLQKIEDPESFLACAEELRAHPDRARRDLIHLKDGRILERYTQPYYVDDEIYGRVCNFEDVTERIQAEEALRKRENQFREMIISNADAMVVVDDKGTLCFINPAGERLFGRPAREMLGQAFGAPIILKDKAEIEVFRPDGTMTLVEMSVSPIEWEGRLASLASLRDFTDRHQAQEALAWEAGVNAAIAELARALIRMAELEEISYVILQQAKKLTGSTFGYVGHIDPQTGHLVCTTMTRDIWDMCQVPDKSIVFKAFGGLWGWVLDNRQPLMTNDLTNDPRSTGTPAGHIPIERFLSVPAMIGETLLGQIALANPSRPYADRDMDLVERLASLYALAVQRQRAEEERDHLINELDAFAHTVAHDLKTPLSGIAGYAEELEEDFDDISRDERQHYLHTITKSARKMASIVDGLLLLASVRETKRVDLTPLDMSAIVADVQERLSYLIHARGAKVYLRNGGPWPHALGYAPWVENIWSNYLSNAIKYGGSSPEITLGFTRQSDDTVRFWVQDNGPGLRPEEQARIFRPFTRLNPQEIEGYGLGLSIVSRIVERLGGQVGVDSTLGEGCTFWFELPAAGA